MNDGLMLKLNNARDIAFLGHKGQVRKYSGLPYITHPEQIFKRVALWTWKKNLPRPQRFRMMGGSWMHDVKEDCPDITDEMILEATEASWLELVKELTNPSKGSKLNRAARKQMDREHLKHISWDGKVIKLIDRSENLKDVSICPEKDFIGLYARESELLLEALAGTDEELERELLERIVVAKYYAQNRIQWTTITPPDAHIQVRTAPIPDWQYKKEE